MQDCIMETQNEDVILNFFFNVNVLPAISTVKTPIICEINIDLCF